MHDSTYSYIFKRALQAGLDPHDLRVEGTSTNAKWEIEVIYNSKDDEILYLGDTSYEVNVLEWIAENVAIEATIEGGIDSEPHWWAVRLYRANEKGEESVRFERNEEEYGPVLCLYNTGDDPSGCDNLVTGHDMLCTEHRLAYYETNKAAAKEEKS